MSNTSDLLTILSIDREEIIKRMDPYFLKLDEELPLTISEEMHFSQLMSQWEALNAEIDPHWESLDKPQKRSFMQRIFRKL